MSDVLTVLLDMLADRVAERLAVPGPRMLSISEAATFAGCSEWTIRQAINLGELPFVDFDRRKRVLREDVDAWIKRNRIER